MSKPKFKVGDRVRWLEDRNPARGAEAVVIRPRYEAHGDTYIEIKWDRDHTRHGRSDGGYYERSFELVKPAKIKKPSQAYRGNGKHQWESVNSEDFASTHRLRVPGGWLYRRHGAMTFVPMPEVVKHAV